MMNKKNILYIVIPCYNEEAVIRETARQVAIKMQQLYEKELISEKTFSEFSWEKVLNFMPQK